MSTTPGEELEKIRKSKNLNQTAVARELGLSRESVRLWEKNKLMISGSHFDSLAKLYKISPNEFAVKLGLSRSGVDLEKGTDKLTRLDPHEAVGRNVSLVAGCEFSQLNEREMLVLMPLLEYNLWKDYLSQHLDNDFLTRLPKHSMIVHPKDVGTYRGFRIHGDWMDNGSKQSLVAGHIATGLAVDSDLRKEKLSLHTFVDYAIVHRHEGPMIRRIIDHDVSKQKLICQSLNESYQGFNIDLENVLELYKIVATTRRFGNL
ncbi:helix-turn-helix domain-containing protein [Dyadobacter sp. BHUBP1]|uniref:helix-turn-helix domain-containing protein n=1 Tax=Dyadobacter sp. BHUBP1 TaxID=3424178 RepID=UPI003D34E0BB